MLPITKIQRFSTHDGPGIRTVVFTKGCRLTCRWCHNPECLSHARDRYFDEAGCMGCGACDGHTRVGGCPTGALRPAVTPMQIDGIIGTVMRDAAFYGNDGGLTLSGGEPMLHAETLDLIAAAKAKGLHVVVETCGLFDPAYLLPLVAADLVYWDIKDTDDTRHTRYTGASNRAVTNNLLAFDALGGHTLLRCLMVRGVNMDERHLREVAGLRRRLKHCQGIELLPYHPYGATKYRHLGLPWTGDAAWQPSKADMAWARDVLLTASPAR
jgi:pyruvate formate lyase activating enzyme